MPGKLFHRPTGTMLSSIALVRRARRQFAECQSTMTLPLQRADLRFSSFLNKKFDPPTDDAPSAGQARNASKSSASTTGSRKSHNGLLPSFSCSCSTSPVYISSCSSSSFGEFFSHVRDSADSKTSMWQDSESRLDDLAKVALLVRSQIKFSLADEGTRSWLDLERDFLETNYRTIRDRQMQLLEEEDGMLARPSILELRDKLGKEAYDVLGEQR